MSFQGIVCPEKDKQLLRKKNKDAKWCIQTLFKRRFGSWNCWEKIEINVAKRSILTLFKTIFLFFNSLIKYLFKPDPLHPHVYCFFVYKSDLYFWLSIQLSRTSKRACHPPVNRFLFFSLLWFMIGLYIRQCQKYCKNVNNCKKKKIRQKSNLPWTNESN